jgi:putative sterol carrier protein
MGSKTFDAICAKEMSGFTAFVSGKMKCKGNLSHMQKWDTQVAKKYMGKKLE